MIRFWRRRHQGATDAPTEVGTPGTEHTYAVLADLESNRPRVVGLHCTEREAMAAAQTWSSRGPTEIVMFDPESDLRAAKRALDSVWAPLQVQMELALLSMELYDAAFDQRCT